MFRNPNNKLLNQLMIKLESMHVILTAEAGLQINKVVDEFEDEF